MRKTTQRPQQSAGPASSAPGPHRPGHLSAINDLARTDEGPVMEDRGETHPNEYTIVVGVDGSPPSRAAIHWAVEHAKLTGGVVQALIAWQYPAFACWEGAILPPEEFEAPARKILTETVETTVDRSSRELVVRQDVVHGHSAEVLLAAASNADLLVLGSHRGHGPLRIRRGSVSRRCVRRCRCSVVLIRV